MGTQHSRSTSGFPLPAIDPLTLRQTDGEELDEEKTGRAHAILYRLGPSTLVTKVVGHPELAQAELLIRRSEALIRRAGTIRIFHDWFGVTGYKAEVRARLTPWSQETAPNHDGVYVGSQSRLVRMGVTVVQLLSGTPIVAFATLAELERELASSLRSRSAACLSVEAISAMVRPRPVKRAARRLAVVAVSLGLAAAAFSASRQLGASARTAPCQRSAAPSPPRAIAAPTTGDMPDLAGFPPAPVPTTVRLVVRRRLIEEHHPPGGDPFM
jgi:hypothetical protein